MENTSTIFLEEIIWNAYISDDAKNRLIQEQLQYIFECWERLLFLEYWNIFHNANISLPNDSYKSIQKLYKILLPYFDSIVLKPLCTFWDKYLSLSQSDIEDRLSKLYLFYKMSTVQRSLISIADGQDILEQFIHFREEWSFWADVNYEQYPEHTYLLYKGKSLVVSPLFLLSPVEDMEDYDALTIATSCSEFLWQQQNMIDTLENIPPIMPWVQEQIEDKIQEAFFSMDQQNEAQIFCVYGYPKTGKTVLAYQIQEIYNTKYTLFYYHFPKQSNINHFKEYIQTIKNNQIDKTIVLLDSIENLTNIEYTVIKNTIKKYRLNKTLFILFQRTNTMPQVQSHYVLYLQSDEAEDFLTPSLQEEVINEYVVTEDSQKVFQYLANTMPNSWTSAELAIQCNISFISIVQTLNLMSPLLVIQSNNTTGEKKYTLFSSKLMSNS